MLWPQNAFTIVHDWENLNMLMFASQNHLHMFAFRDAVNLLGSAPGKA